MLARGSCRVVNATLTAESLPLGTVNIARKGNRSEHAIIADGEKDQGQNRKAGNDWMVQDPGKRGFKDIIQCVINNPAHWKSSPAQRPFYNKTRPVRKKS